MAALAMFGGAVLLLMLLLLAGAAAYVGFLVMEALHENGLAGWVDRVLDLARGR